jgi:hypothetical protein
LKILLWGMAGGPIGRPCLNDLHRRLGLSDAQNRSPRYMEKKEEGKGLPACEKSERGLGSRKKATRRDRRPRFRLPCQRASSSAVTVTALKKVHFRSLNYSKSLLLVLELSFDLE